MSLGEFPELHFICSFATVVFHLRRWHNKHPLRTRVEAGMSGGGEAAKSARRRNQRGRIFGLLFII